MLRTLLLSSLLLGAAAAEADVYKNGKDLNGKDHNGKDLNGKDLNGKDLNGSTMSATAVEGSQLVTWVRGSKTTLVKKSGTQLIGARLQVAGESSFELTIDAAGTLPSPNSDVWAYTVSAEYWQNGCAHHGYQQGIRLDPQCSNVEGAVCARDEFCCSVRWDQQCVNEFWEEHAAASASGAGWNYYWHRHREESICGQDGDEDGSWRSYRPLRKGVFVQGKWSAAEGVPGGGGKTRFDGSGAPYLTFACLASPNGRGGGAIGKCVVNGYKPWVNHAKDRLHQACVRMYRADFCGDGVSWTENGNPIDLWDSYSPAIQTSETSWASEAVWEAAGALYMHDAQKARTASSPATGGRSLQQYQAWKRSIYGSSYCRGNFAQSWGGCWDASNSGVCAQTYTKVP